MNRKFRSLIKVSLFLILLILLSHLFLILINRSRKPSRTSSPETTDLADYIFTMPVNVLYIRDLEGFVGKCSSNSTATALWNSYLKQPYEKIRNDLAKDIPLIGLDTIIYGILGNEALIYSDTGDNIFLLSKTKLLSQIALNCILYLQANKKDLSMSEDCYILPTSLKEYPEIYIKTFGSVLSVSTQKIPENMHPAQTGPYISNMNPDIILSLKDAGTLLKYVKISRRSPASTMLRILIDRKITLLLLGFESGDLYCSLFSSSLSDNSVSIGENLKLLQGRILDKYPFFLHFNTPKSIRIENNMLFYNESRIMNFNTDSSPVYISTPINLLVADSDDSTQWPLIQAEFRSLRDFSRIEQSMNKKRLPFSLFFKQDKGFSTISTKAYGENPYQKLGNDDFYKKDHERLYFYFDSCRFYRASGRILMPLAFIYPGITPFARGLENICRANGNIILNLYSSRFETVFTITAK